MVEKTGALQGHAPEMVGDAPLMHKGLAAAGVAQPYVHVRNKWVNDSLDWLPSNDHTFLCFRISHFAFA